MYFDDLKLLLLERIRRRVHNGEVSERSLARLIGVSQPHMHNLLKGTRALTDEVADGMLYQLRISLLDLCDPRLLERHTAALAAGAPHSVALPVLRGRIGPGNSWPTEAEKHERLHVPVTAVTDMWQPVVCRLGEDELMLPLFAAGDFVLLDQSNTVRTRIVDDRLYLIKQGDTGLIRHVRRIGSTHYIYTASAQNRRAQWERLPEDEASLPHFIRAKATLIAPESCWPV
jgi:hypothetical protein